VATFRAVIVEGKDDVAAIRALLSSHELTQDRTRTALSAHRIRFIRPDLGVDVVAAPPGKDTLAVRTLDALEGTATARPDRVLVCFDPDDDLPANTSSSSSMTSIVLGSDGQDLSSSPTTASTPCESKIATRASFPRRGAGAVSRRTTSSRT
jgi:hypothetical protein